MSEHETHLEKFKALFTECGIPFEFNDASEIEDYELRSAGIKAGTVLTMMVTTGQEQNHKRDLGYNGFYAGYIFDPSGKLIAYGSWE